MLEPELDDVIPAAADRPGDGLARPGSIVGMDKLEEPIAIAGEGSGGQAEELLELGAPGDLLGLQVALPPTDLPAAHGKGERGLGAAQRLLRLADIVDVGGGPVPEDSIPVRRRHRNPAAEVPAVSPVGHAEPMLM